MMNASLFVVWGFVDGLLWFGKEVEVDAKTKYRSQTLNAAEAETNSVLMQAGKMGITGGGEKRQDWRKWVQV